MCQFLWACVLLLFLCCCHAQKTVDGNKILKAKGFLVFIPDDVVVFIKDKRASSHYSLDDFQKHKGRQIRGNFSYSMIKAKEDAKPYNVKKHLYEVKTKMSYEISDTIKVIAVEISYYIYKGMLEMGKENGIGYSYDGKRYSIEFIDDWNVAIEDIKYLK